MTLHNEFRLGKKRVIVPVTMTRMIMEEDGSVTPMFDDNDVEFYTLDMGDKAENKLKSIWKSGRSSDHGMDKTLALLSKCGLGTDRYKFENGAVKTATEVISKNQTCSSLRSTRLSSKAPWKKWLKQLRCCWV